MVFVSVWSEFVERSLELYCAQPSRARYVLKYRPGDQEVVLRVTDDFKVLQYRTQHNNELKLLEQWNNIMFKLCTTPNPVAATIAAEVEEEMRAEREASKRKPAARKAGKQ